LVFDGKLEMGHARALLALDGRRQETVAKRVATRALSVRQTEDLVNAILHPAKAKRRLGSDRDVARLEEELSEEIGTTIQIKPEKKERGSSSSAIRVPITWTTSCPGSAAGPDGRVPERPGRRQGRAPMDARREWPKEGITRIPYWIYSDPEVYAREQERVFCGPSWSYVALETELPRPGDFKRTFIGEKRSSWCATRMARSTSSRTAAPIEECSSASGTSATRPSSCARITSGHTT